MKKIYKALRRKTCPRCGSKRLGMRCDGSRFCRRCGQRWGQEGTWLDSFDRRTLKGGDNEKAHSSRSIAGQEPAT